METFIVRMNKSTGPRTGSSWQWFVFSWQLFPTYVDAESPATNGGTDHVHSRTDHRPPHERHQPPPPRAPAGRRGVRSHGVGLPGRGRGSRLGARPALDVPVGGRRVPRAV